MFYLQTCCFFPSTIVFWNYFRSQLDDMVTNNLLVMNMRMLVGPLVSVRKVVLCVYRSLDQAVHSTMP